ncbi:MAG: hypothetical protein WCI60_02945 [bacterium]
MIKIEPILNQTMDRKKFLSLIGVGIISVFGIPTLLGILTPDQKKIITSGYGSSRYNT